MLKIKNVTAKNFMSVGNNLQAVNFDTDSLTLVLGHNLDLGGDGSRNGTGKTTIINALSFALYGEALTNIRKDNLINKTNGKGMITTNWQEHLLLGTSSNAVLKPRAVIMLFLMKQEHLKTLDTPLLKYTKTVRLLSPNIKTQEE